MRRHASGLSELLAVHRDSRPAHPGWSRVPGVLGRLHRLGGPAGGGDTVEVAAVVTRAGGMHVGRMRASGVPVQSRMRWRWGWIIFAAAAWIVAAFVLWACWTVAAAVLGNLLL